MNLLQRLFKFLFPDICSWCTQKSDQDKALCKLCEDYLPWALDRCYRCGLIIEKETESIICEKCQNKLPPFDRMCCLFSYQPPITHWISGLKFSKKLYFGHILGELLLNQIPVWYKNEDLPDMVIPVPLHSERIKKRGFNQSYELLLPLKKSKILPIQIAGILRHKSTRAQALLNKEFRIQNLKNAFTVTQDFTGKHIALLDDVVTTGCTVKAIASLLKEKGAERVDIWCIARA
ncbi:MAG: competence protein [Francisellaceae bacterium]|nr:competence protein [Francisellaceae bacterium]